VILDGKYVYQKPEHKALVKNASNNAPPANNANAKKQEHKIMIVIKFFSFFNYFFLNNITFLQDKHEVFEGDKPSSTLNL
jgi:hypothetical protein